MIAELLVRTFTVILLEAANEREHPAALDRDKGVSSTPAREPGGWGDGELLVQGRLPGQGLLK
jgi:hypothetical protein